MTISVVMATFNREHSVGLALAALSKQTYKDFEVIIVDDGGDDDTLVEIENAVFDYGLDIRYIWHPHHGFGLARSRNEGTKIAKGNVFHFIDSDIMLIPEAIENVARMMEQNRDRAIGGFYKYLPGMLITKKDVLEKWELVWGEELPAIPVYQYCVPIGQDIREAWHDAEIVGENVFNYEDTVCWSPFILLGGNMVIPRHIFEQTGGFDEKFTVYGGEDAEMSLAIISRGYGISYSKSIAGAHIAHVKEQSATVGDGGEMDHRRYIASKYPYFLNPDGTPILEVWGKPVSR